VALWPHIGFARPPFQSSWRPSWSPAGSTDFSAKNPHTRKPLTFQHCLHWHPVFPEPAGDTEQTPARATRFPAVQTV